MSERQKKMAKRLVEILDKMDVINPSTIVNGYMCSYKSKDVTPYECRMPYKDWIQELTQAIATYQAEELEKELPWKPDLSQVMSIEDSLKKMDAEEKRVKNERKKNKKR